MTPKDHTPDPEALATFSLPPPPVEPTPPGDTSKSVASAPLPPSVTDAPPEPKPVSAQAPPQPVGFGDLLTRVNACAAALHGTGDGRQRTLLDTARAMARSGCLPDLGRVLPILESAEQFARAHDLLPKAK
jgi:hypothetical protein